MPENLGLKTEDELYCMSRNAREAYAEKLEEMLASNSKSGLTEEQVLCIRINLARCLGDISGRPVRNLAAALGHLQIARCNTERTTIQQAQIILLEANLLRLSNCSADAKKLLAVYPMPDAETNMMRNWILAAISQDNLGFYKMYTQAALGEFENIPQEQRGSMVMDRYVCLITWKFYQAYRCELSQRFVEGRVGQSQLDTQEVEYQEIVELCKSEGIRRLVDIHLHYAVLQAYVFGNAQEARKAIIEAEVEAEKVGANYVPGFKAQVEAMLAIIAGEEVIQGALDLGTYTEENRAWWNLLTARTLVLIDIYEKRYADPEELKVKISAIKLPEEFYTLKVPEEIRAGVKRILEKIEELTK